MNHGLDLILLAALVSSVWILSSSRLLNCFRWMAVQGVTLGLLPWTVGVMSSSFGYVYALMSIGVRGVLFPWLLLRAIRQVNVQREVEPYVGYGASLLFATAALALCAWLSSRLPLPGLAPSAYAVTVSLFLCLAGLFVIISRKKAISQVLGYLMLENGIFAFGVLFVRHQPAVVEVGVLLDVFAAVFVMGIAIFHISKEFDHVDADQLTSLKD